MLSDWIPYVVGTVIVFGSYRLIKGGVSKFWKAVRKDRKDIEDGNKPVKHL